MDRHWILFNTAAHDFSSNNTYVYELINPETNQPFYVGKGRDNRAMKHISLRKNKQMSKANPHKTNTINQIISRGGKVIVNIVSTHITEDEAFTCEMQLVERYGRQCNNTGILTNITRGGDGATRDGLPVDQYTLTGEHIRTWTNAKEAARANGWQNYSTICACCKGRERSYKKFLWAYTGQLPKMSTKIKPVYQWTLQGELVKIHPSISSAARELSCDRTTISAQINGKAVGFLWSHENTPPAYVCSVGVKRSVINLTTGVVYKTVTDAAIDNNDSVSNISAVCNGKQKTSKGQKYAYSGFIPSDQ